MLWLGVGPHAVETVFTVTVQWAPGFTDLTPVTHLHSSRCEPSLLPPLASFGGYVKSLSQNTRETGETVCGPSRAVHTHQPTTGLLAWLPLPYPTCTRSQRMHNSTKVTRKGSTPRSARERSPSERKAAHDEKLKALAMRRAEMHGVGPGTYEPRGDRNGRDRTGRIGSTTDWERPSAWGKSKTERRHGSIDRMLRDITLSMDPGHYHGVDVRGDLGTRLTGGSFAKSARRGQAAFGAACPRKLHLEILGGDDSRTNSYTPGPGEHEVKRPQKDGRMDCGAISAFKSSSLQFGKVANTDVPPPGAYDVKEGMGVDEFSSLRPRVQNGAYSMKIKGDRFRAAVNTFTHAPAPYYTKDTPFYGVECLPNGSRSTMYGAARVSLFEKGSSAAFRSESVRDLTRRYFASEPYF